MSQNSNQEIFGEVKGGQERIHGSTDDCDVILLNFPLSSWVPVL